MSGIIESISPAYIGEDKIIVSVDPVSLPMLAGGVITLNFDYSATYPAGPMVPMVLQVQPAFGDGTGYFKKTFRRKPPVSFAFLARSAGQYLAVLREVGHNGWQGRILLTVGGETFTQIQSSR